jgi:hypothetical protein
MQLLSHVSFSDVHASSCTIHGLEDAVLKNNVTNVQTFVFATEAALAVASLG